MLYCIVFYHTIVLYCKVIVSFGIILYLNVVVPYCIMVLYCIIPYSIVYYYIIYYHILYHIGRLLTRSYYRNSSGVIVAYSVSDRESYESVPDWVREAREQTGTDNPAIVMVGCKADIAIRDPFMRQVGGWLNPYVTKTWIKHEDCIMAFS